jgi:Aspartyl protease
VLFDFRAAVAGLLARLASEGRFTGSISAISAAFVAASFLACTAARAETFTPAAITLDDLLAHSRHVYGTMAPGAYHRVERSVTSDGTITVTETFSNGDDYKTTVSRDGFTSGYGSFNGYGWFQDDGGFVRSSERNATPDPFAYALRHPDDAASGMKVLGSVTTPSAYVIEIAPRPGLRQLRYYDQQTYFLLKVVTTNYSGHTDTREYGNFIAIGGRFVAHTWTDSSDAEKRTTRTDITTYESVDPRQAHLDVPVSRTPFDLGGRSSVAIPADLSDGRIVVRLNVGSRGLDFILDSGASVSVIDAGVAAQLGLPLFDTHRGSFGGDFTDSKTRIPQLTIGDITAANVPMTVIAHQEQSDTRRVVGLLGCDFIASGALLIDYGTKTVTLWATVPPDLESKGWSVLPIALGDCVPRVKVAFNGRPGSFLIDLGAFGTILTPHYFAGFNDRENVPDTLRMSAIGGSPIGAKQYTIGAMQFGETTFGGVRVTVPSSNLVDSRSEDGVIGRDFLQNFDLLFDYAHQKLYYKAIAVDPQ